MLRHELSPVAQQSVRRACFDSRLYAFQLLAAFSKALNTRGLMINDNELDRTIAELRALLTQLTGVSVEYIDVRSSRIDIVLIVERIESVGPIVYACDGANVALRLWSVASSGPASAQASAASVRYQVSALATHDATVSAREKVEIFGIYLVNFACAIDAITQTEADRLLVLWNGIKRSV